MTVVNVSLVHLRTVYQDIPLIGKCLCPSKRPNDRASDPQRAPFLTVLVSIGYTAGIFSNNRKNDYFGSNKVWEMGVPEKITGRCHLIHNFPWTQKVQLTNSVSLEGSLCGLNSKVSLNLWMLQLSARSCSENELVITFICVVAENNNKEPLQHKKQNKAKPKQYNACTWGYHSLSHTVFWMFKNNFATSNLFTERATIGTFFFFFQRQICEWRGQ